MAIESDIQNANSRLAVYFHKKSKQNELKSEQEGRPIFEDVIYIRKMVPGDNLNIIDRPMYESDKNEFPMQWAHYQNKQGSDQMVSGTPLIEWPLLTTAQAEVAKLGEHNFRRTILHLCKTKSECSYWETFEIFTNNQRNANRIIDEMP